MTATSPEAIALDVIGYDLAATLGPTLGGGLVTAPQSSVGAGSANYPTSNYPMSNYGQSARSTATAAEMPQSTRLQTTYGSSGQPSQTIELGGATNAAQTQIVGHWKDGLYIVDGVWVEGAFKTCGTEKYPCILIPRPPSHATAKARKS